MNIIKLGNAPAVDFAGEELCRYLKMLAVDASVQEKPGTRYQPGTGALWVGIDPAFGALLPPVKDPQLDDGIYICARQDGGIITGTNPRSVLIAVYRFLKELGVRWIRPGPDGEILPRKAVCSWDVYVNEAAAYRHRTICIEGAVSIGHVENMLDWIPKAAMNSYFIQFQVPYTFFDRWYRHVENPTMAPEPLSHGDVVRFQRRIEEQVAKRGLMLHAVGHSWTCEPFGIQGEGWEPMKAPLPDGVREKLALVNGKRELWGEIALNTNLCYSDPQVRQTMADGVAAYCREHPDVRYVHVWLADGANNHCECPACRQRMPSDFYIALLNQIDRTLTAKGLTTKVVFLLYLDLLWVSGQTRIQNPDRFMMMFAPITRSYTDQYIQPGSMAKGTMLPYVRNKLKFPKKVEDNLAYLRSWQAVFQGDSVDFDYHMMWDHLRDPGYYRCAQVLLADVQNLDRMGLNGFISCQPQRAAFPTGLPMEMMARGLWDKHADFEEEAAAYFSCAFGEDGEAAAQYLQTLSRQTVPPYSRGELPWTNPGVVQSLQEAKKTISGFADRIEQNIARTRGNVQKSWIYLRYHGALTQRYADLLLASASGDEAAMKVRARALMDHARQIEPQVHLVFDLDCYKYVVDKLLQRMDFSWEQE